MKRGQGFSLGFLTTKPLTEKTTINIQEATSDASICHRTSHSLTFLMDLLFINIFIVPGIKAFCFSTEFDCSHYSKRQKWSTSCLWYQGFLPKAVVLKLCAMMHLQGHHVISSSWLARPRLHKILYTGLLQDLVQFSLSGNDFIGWCYWQRASHQWYVWELLI